MGIRLGNPPKGNHQLDGSESPFPHSLLKTGKMLAQVAPLIGQKEVPRLVACNKMAFEKKRKNVKPRNPSSQYCSCLFLNVRITEKGVLTRTKSPANIGKCGLICWPKSCTAAPPKPWNDSIPLQHQQAFWIPMVSKWCEADFVHSMSLPS